MCGASRATPLDNFPPMGARPRLSAQRQLRLTPCEPVTSARLARRLRRRHRIARGREGRLAPSVRVIRGLYLSCPHQYPADGVLGRLGGLSSSTRPLPRKSKARPELGPAKPVQPP